MRIFSALIAGKFIRWTFQHKRILEREELAFEIVTDVGGAQ